MVVVERKEKLEPRFCVSHDLKPPCRHSHPGHSWSTQLAESLALTGGRLRARARDTPAVYIQEREQLP